MGNSPPPKNYQPKMEKLKLEIACMKVKGHLEIQRDRRMAQANGKEQQLIGMINHASRSMVEEKHKAASIVSDICFIDACNIVIRCCDILKDRSMHICESKGNVDAVKELIPFVQSVVWAKKQLNLDCMQEFSTQMMSFFGSEKNLNLFVDDSMVDAELKRCFQNVMPSDAEINNYLYKLSMKTGLTLQVINSVGHNAGPDCCGSNNNNNNNNGGHHGGNGGQQQQQQVPIFIPSNGFNQQQQGNLNINIRVQEMPNQANHQYPPFNNGYGQQQPQQPMQTFQPQQQQFVPQNNFVPQYSQQIPQNQFQPQQQQQQQQQYPTFDQAPQQNNQPTYNFPQVTVPQFQIPNSGQQQQPQQQQQQQQPQQFYGGQQPPAANIPVTQNQPPANDYSASNEFEERLKRIRNGL